MADNRGVFIEEFIEMGEGDSNLRLIERGVEVVREI
jgi:hypothetical protein